MPVKTLPKKLVKRLKNASPVISRYLGRMKNIDHRSDLRNNSIESTSTWGRRVRQMDVSKNYPKTELVIKRTHKKSVSDSDSNARRTVSFIRGMVKKHNSKYGAESGYVLIVPKAYAIRKDLIAMAKTDCPSIEEITGNPEDRTQRGKMFFEKIQEKYGVTEQQLDDKFNLLWRRIRRAEPDKGNIVLLGYKKGAFIFMPLVDLI